ncbi:MAG: hypothetical protein JJT99_14970 [Rhodobacteraceae bacterium]|nr:hypothetical protein [Paracoccaceae bacterium]
MASDKEERGVASGDEKAAWETVPVSGQSSLAFGILMPGAVDWIMLTCGYALTGVIILTSVQFLLG